ncbi:aminopeptidase N-like [Pectinophora gossypiella]|uniref:aminopeptidase N-like n=1 Tax=Pectinophora gossypiella TaxID=13191 RepID=UPI00214F5DA1|nr:aminopeptidase N-like [Pectinophora gossypiella]XP_049880548.1 aminopeptidase N-like [Pectinophora gossypiella]
MWRCVCVLAVFVGICGAQAQPDYLLPGDIRPYHYDLRLLYDIDPASNFSYYGVVDILLTVKKATSKIILHAQDMTVDDNGIVLTGQNPPKVKGASIDETYDFLTVELDKNLVENANYTLSIPFHGNLKMGLNGAYVSSYTDTASRTKQYLVTTQFEPIEARKAFPCFDEPMYKASFTITLGHNRGYNAVSNMPLVNSTQDNVMETYWPWSTIENTYRKDRSYFVWDQFGKSVPMSTYLVAFVISKFESRASPPGLSDTVFRIWARKDAIDQTEYAATIGPKVLTTFEKFFNVSFPLPKQDMIAIPDFSAGAMENWGLITYRESTLLYDKDQSSFTNKERIAEVVAHELAHQWFGNLVTMKWWSDLWLNEGFATYVASIGVNAVEPTWRADITFAVENILAYLPLDSLESSHPVSVHLDHPKRIMEIFDDISYRKGSSVIRMMTMFLGEDVFRKALHNYLVKYSYKNAAQDDLWRELTAVSQQYGRLASNMTVKQVMDTWTTQTGYPLLTVTRDYSEKSLTISQKRYINLGVKAPTAVSWWIPLSVMCQSEADQPAEPVQWLSVEEGVANEHRFEHSAKANEWIIFNYDMIAPYRINYDKRNWQLLIKTLNSDQYSTIPQLGRVQLLSDAFAFSWTQQLDYSITLQLANYLQREMEYLPLMSGLRGISKLESVLLRTSEYGALQKFIRQLIGDQYMQAGGLSRKAILNGEDLNSVKLQTLTSTWACKSMYPGCEENAVDLFQQWMDETDPDANNPIPLDLRRIVYCVAVRRGGVREWRFLLARNQKANVASAKDQAMYGLSCTNVVWILRQYLTWCIEDNSEVRRQDAARVLILVIQSPVGYYIARDFIYSRFDDIAHAFKSQGLMRRLGTVIKTLLEQFTTKRELDEFLAWKEKYNHHLEDSKLTVTQGIEAAHVNIEWLLRNKKTVVEKLREFSS